MMAARKRREGCDACVDAYVDLARDHGATDADIAAALGDDAADGKGTYDSGR
ncbi:carboxymuconolactone decarboxylase family protein [Nocardia sp. BMG51109]|uniref:carboxymuconolactone decarboxylase family protein n=1 Tax=Nocardia sp. BMG51109 TaxID=1056816 RepID=UPI0035101DB2